MQTLKDWFVRQGIEDLWSENVQEAEEILVSLASEKQWDDIKEICNDFNLPKLKIAYLKGYLIKRVKEPNKTQEEIQENKYNEIDTNNNNEIIKEMIDGIHDDDSNHPLIKIYNNYISEKGEIPSNKYDLINYIEFKQIHGININAIGDFLIHHQKSQHIALDLDIFKTKEQTCDKNAPIHNCLCLKRLINALRYYDTINEDKLIDFCDNTYHNVLNDHMHLMTNHADDVQEIHDILMKQYTFSKCNVLKCELVQRHHRNRNDEEEKDVSSHFYVELFDSLHYYLVHLFDSGLRINDKDIESMDITNHDINNNNDECFDEEFSKIQQIINRKKKESDMFERYDNGKFSIQFGSVSKENKDDEQQELTFTTAMFNHSSENGISQGFITKLSVFLRDEAYDTDCIIEDCYVDTVDAFGNIQSNIIHYIKNEDFLESITQFISNNDLSAGSFSIGLIFYYWPYYKDYIEQKDMDQVQISNVNDHGGHDIKDLYIERRHDSLKEDLLESGYIDKKKYDVLIWCKAEKLITSNLAKQTKAAGGKWMKHLHYDIEEGTPLTMDNLICIIAYCDFSDLCTHFTSTFRSIKPFESLSSIKKRNQKYWWFSKILRETVQCFGDNKEGRNYGDEWRNVSGPFYCGMSVVMSIPEFNIRLCSPTSTSKQITVATRFGGDKGMIIQLNNNGDAVCARYLRCFNCTPYSKYPEEDERFFFGGDYRIRIMSMRNIDTHQNYARFFRPLFFFDALIDGSDPLGSGCDNIKQKDVFILSSLINIELGSIGNNKFDKYVEDTFHLFCLKKTQIIINLSYMDLYFKHSKLHHLIMNSVQRDTDNVAIMDDDEYRNLFRSNVFLMFHNIREIVIYSSSNVYGSYESYSFSFLSLLSLMDQLPIDIQITIKATWKPNTRPSWIQQSFDSQMKAQFNAKAFKTTLKITQNGRNENEDCLIINNGFDPLFTLQSPRFPRISSYERTTPSAAFINDIYNVHERERHERSTSFLMHEFVPPPPDAAMNLSPPSSIHMILPYQVYPMYNVPPPPIPPPPNTDIINVPPPPIPPLPPPPNTDEYIPLAPPPIAAHKPSMDLLYEMEFIGKATWEHNDDSSWNDEYSDSSEDSDEDKAHLSPFSKSNTAHNDEKNEFDIIKNENEDDNQVNPWISTDKKKQKVMVISNQNEYETSYWKIGEEQRFTIIEWVKNKYHLDSHKKALFGKHSSNMVHLLSAIPHKRLKSPLNKDCYDDDVLRGQCMQCWKNINSYLGLRSSSKSSDGHMDKLMQYGIRGSDELRNEIYCQLIKQVTNNKKLSSELLGWKLLLICCSFFSPSLQFIDYLSCWIYSNLGKTNGVGDYAKRVLNALNETMANGSRKFGPSPLEIKHLEDVQSVVVNIYFVNGYKCLDVLITSQSTAKQVVESISNVCHFKYPSNFCLYEMEGNDRWSLQEIRNHYKERESMNQTEKINDLANISFKRELRDSDRILDVLSSWNRRTQSKTIKLCLRLRLFRISMESAALSILESKIIFLDNIYYVINGYYPIGTDSEDTAFALSLAALQLQGTHGMQFYEEGSIQYDLDKYLPQKILRQNSNELELKKCEEEILKIRSNKYSNITRYECWQKYGPMLRNNKKLYLINYFGSRWFHGVVIKNDHDLLGADRITNDLLIGINENGVSFVNPNTQNIIERYDIKEILSFTFRSNSILFVAGTSTAKTKIQIATMHSYEMNHLLTNHINHKIFQQNVKHQIFNVQDKIRIKNQQNKLNWNEKMAIIIGPFNTDKQRYPVQIQIENKPTAFIKPSDMTLIHQQTTNIKKATNHNRDVDKEEDDDDDDCIRESFVFKV